MPSTVRIDHTISGPALDALRASGTTATGPTARPARGVNAWAFVDGKLWPAALVLALLVVAVATFGAWRSTRTAPIAAYAPPAVAAPVATVAVPALAVTPAPTAVEVYAVAPTMTLWCDGRRVEMTSARQVSGYYRAGCVAAFGWCSACQDAWYDAHP